MRLHTNIHTGGSIIDAINRAKDSGKMADHIHFHIFEEKSSRSHNRAYEIQLGTYDKIKGDKRGYKNSGTHGAGNVYAATYDEWGWFIAELYTVDKSMVFGGYKGHYSFLTQTKFAYDI